MARFIKNRSVRRASPPGAFNFDVLPNACNTKGHYIQYSLNEVIEKDFDPTYVQSLEKLDPTRVHWFHIEGFGKEDFFRIIRDTFQIPSFQMADVLNIDHHPKIEDLDDLLFFLLKAVNIEGDQASGVRVAYNHLGVFLGEHFVLTFSEKPTKVFDFVKDRILQKKGKIREKKEDFLFYSMVDAVVNNYFYVVEVLGTEVEGLEKTVSSETLNQHVLSKINRLKTEFLFLRKLTQPVDESVHLMVNLADKFFEEDLEDYLTDLQDHSKQLVSVISGYYAMLNDILLIYTANINLQTNRIITFLTLFTSIFIPLTFIVGVYGMNFKHIPELETEYGYYIVWAINIMIAVLMLLFFKRKKWL